MSSSLHDEYQLIECKIFYFLFRKYLTSQFLYIYMQIITKKIVYREKSHQKVEHY